MSSTVLTTVELFVNVATLVRVSASPTAVDTVVLVVAERDTLATVVFTEVAAVELTGENVKASVTLWRAVVVLCRFVLSVVFCPTVPPDGVTAVVGELVRRTGCAAEE